MEPPTIMFTQTIQIKNTTLYPLVGGTPATHYYQEIVSVLATVLVLAAVLKSC
jgi:hypothetical protein